MRRWNRSMTKEINTIIHNLKESFNGTPWYGISMMAKLDAIPWEIVNKEIYGSKTIAILVQHIINWRIFILKKLDGDLNFDISIDGENDWDKVHIAGQEEWGILKQKLQNTQDILLKMLSQESDELLQKRVPGKEYTFGPILTSIGQHDIYHLGQIAMLNALHKS